MNFIDVRSALLAGANDLIKREEELSRLDSFVGDGDHGVTIKKGFGKIIKAVEDNNPQNMFDLFFTSAMAIADVMGGAIGPILASFFLGMGTTLKGKEQIGVQDLAEMFAAGLDSIQELGGAKPGDSTLVDALYPAVQYLKNTSITDPKRAMREAAEKSHEGAKSTANMVAKLGRAKNLGEKSLGYVDAGSMSMYYFLQSFADGI